MVVVVSELVRVLAEAAVFVVDAVMLPDKGFAVAVTLGVALVFAAVPELFEEDAVLAVVFVSGTVAFPAVFPADAVLVVAEVLSLAAVLPPAAVLVVFVLPVGVVLVEEPAGRPGPLFSVTGLDDAVLVVEVRVPVFLVDADAFFVVSAPLSLFEF